MHSIACLINFTVYAQLAFLCAKLLYNLHTSMVYNSMHTEQPAERLLSAIPQILRLFDVSCST